MLAALLKQANVRHTKCLDLEYIADRAIAIPANGNLLKY